MKRVCTLVVLYCFSMLLLTITGTYAYSTDKEEAINIFTIAMESKKEARAAPLNATSSNAILSNATSSDADYYDEYDIDLINNLEIR